MTLILTSNVRTIRTSPPNSFKPAAFVQNLNTNTSETTGKLHECAMGTPEKRATKCTQNTEQWFARSQVHRGGALGWHTVIKKKKIKSITREELHLVSTHRTLHPGDSTSQAALAAVSTGHKTGAVRLLQSLQGGSQHRPQRSKTNTQEKHPYSSGKPAVQRPKGWT